MSGPIGDSVEWKHRQIWELKHRGRGTSGGVSRVTKLELEKRHKIITATSTKMSTLFPSCPVRPMRLARSLQVHTTRRTQISGQQICTRNCEDASDGRRSTQIRLCAMTRTRNRSLLLRARAGNARD